MKALLPFFLFLVSLSVFGQRTVGIFQNDSLSLNGYTLISSLSSTETYLIDNCGDVVNSWTRSVYNPGPVVYLLDDGSLLKTCKLPTGPFIAGGSGGRLERYSWNDSLIWAYNFDSPLERQHHDINVLPSGNILVLAWDLITRNQAITDGLDSTLHNQEVWSEKIVEISPLGRDSAAIVWEWKLWDHIIQDYDSTKNNYGVVSSSRQLVDINFSNNNGISKDFFHANAIDYNIDLDQILISVRNFDEFWIIDHSTTTAEAATNIGGNSGIGGDLLYRWGNPETYKLGTISDKKLYGQHNPNWIKKGYRDEGKIMVFNNGYNAPIPSSTVEIIDPPILVNGNYAIKQDTMFGPDTAEWKYQLPLFVDFVSGAQRLENGNTFITSGPNGHLYELNNQDSVIWKYVNPLQANNMRTSQGSTPTTNAMFRAYRYADNFPAFTSRTLTPLAPIELNPLPSTCVIFNNLLTSISDNTNDSHPSTFTVYPNPTNGSFHIKSKGFQSQIVELIIRDLNGKIIHREQIQDSQIAFEKTFNLSDKSKGMYFISIYGQDEAYSGKLILK